MDPRKKDLYTGIFYVIITVFEIAESVLPWIRYCQIEFSFLTVFALDDGLSYQRKRFQTYSMLRESLCGYFKKVVENACPDLCDNIESLQNAGLLLFSCNIICILLHIFLAILFLSRAKQRYGGYIPSLACWSMAVMKVLLGVVYFEVASPKDFRTPWQYSFDAFLSFGFYFYFVGVMSELMAAYLIYHNQDRLLRSSSEGKLSS
jgi:hypothetical protein